MKSTGDTIHKIRKCEQQFKGEVVKNFDEHVSRSVRLFIVKLKILNESNSEFFVKKDIVNTYLGSSTGTLI